MKKGFISYAHADKDACLTAREHLKPLKDMGLVDFWVDDRIRVGDKMDPKILEAMNAADVFIALISVKFVNSDYILNTELPKIWERQAAGALLCGIVIKSTIWENPELNFKPYLVLPAPDPRNKPINRFRPQDKAWKDSAVAIQHAIEERNRAAS